MWKEPSKREKAPLVSAKALVPLQVMLGPVGEAVGGAGGWGHVWWYFCGVLFAA